MWSDVLNTDVLTPDARGKKMMYKNNTLEIATDSCAGMQIRLHQLSCVFSKNN